MNKELDNEYEYCRWMFKRVMGYINNNDVKQAGISFASDCNTKGIDLGFLKMMFFYQNDKYELIKLICGYSFMPPDLKIYYDNPQKALIDFKI